MPITVLIADDSTLFRAGLARILEDEPDIRVVGQASDVTEVVNKARELKPQVIISDVRLNGHDALESVSLIKDNLPATTTVILTYSEREEDVFRALLYGAQGYLLKSCSKAELLRAVLKAAAGEVMLSESIAATLVKELRAKARSPKLSEREEEVVTLLGEGLNNREIASRLLVSKSTVRTHIYHLQEKLGLKSRAEVSIWASHRSPGFADTAQRLEMLQMDSAHAGERGLISVPAGETHTPSLGTAPRPLTSENKSTASTAIASERKLTTVLSVELSLSGASAKEVAPERAEELIHECLDLVAQDITRYGGTVAWFTASGVMSFFGIPLSLEHAPQRALIASLAIQERMQTHSKQPDSRGVEVNTRMGVNTGAVQVEKYPDSLTNKNIPMGDTTELASRLRDMGEPNTVVVSENTYRLARYLFSFEPLGEARINEQQKRANIYRLMGLGSAKTKLEAAALRGLTKFVGRRRELRTLKEVSSNARAYKGQLVGVVGEAGVGKSRLLLQFRERLPRDAFTYLEGSCIHYGDSIPYLPFKQALKSCFDIVEGDSESVSRAKIEAKILGLGGNVALALPPLCDIMSATVGDDSYTKLGPAQKRMRIFEAVRDILLMESRSKTVVLVIEDCHWIDKTSEELLSYLIDLLADTRIMLVLLYRPEYLHQWGSRSFYTQITLNELPPAMSIELAQSILGDGTADRDLQELIINKAGGNPLFVEELVHDLRESDTIRKKGHEYILAVSPSDVNVPASIQGIIGARIDRLDGDTKYAMQVASVIGRDFRYRILESAARMKMGLKSCLGHLQQQEFIYQRSGTGQPEYAFKHTLIQTVAYDSVAPRKRKEIHRRIAEAIIEEQYPDSPEEFYEILAYHYQSSQSWDKAYQYLKLSADKASRNSSNQEALRLYRESIAALRSLDQSRDTCAKELDVRLAMDGVLRGLDYPEESLANLEEAERLAEELGDTISKAIVLSKMGWYNVYRGNASLGTKQTKAAFEMAAKAEAPDLAIPLALNLALAIFLEGNFIKVIEVASRGIALIEKMHLEEKYHGGFGNENVYCTLLALCGSASSILGRFEESKTFLEKSLAFARRINNPESVIVALTLYGQASWTRGDGKAAAKYLGELMPYVDGMSSPFLAAATCSLMAVAHLLQGDLEAAAGSMKKFSILFERSHGSAFVENVFWIQGWVEMELGLLRKAVCTLGESVEVATADKNRTLEGMGKIWLGRAMFKEDASTYGQAEASLLQGMQICAELGMRPTYSEGCLFLGELYIDAGEKPKAWEQLGRAQSMFQNMGMDYWLSKTQTLLKKLDESDSGAATARI